jgi:hypothetical protein
LKITDGVSSEEISAHGDEDHGVGDVDPLLVVTDEAAPADHPAERAFDRKRCGGTV